MSSLDWILKTDLKGDRLELTAYYNQFKEHHEVECPRCSKNVLVGNQVEQNFKLGLVLKPKDPQMSLYFVPCALHLVDLRQFGNIMHWLISLLNIQKVVKLPLFLGQ